MEDSTDEVALKIVPVLLSIKHLQGDSMGQNANKTSVNSLRRLLPSGPSEKSDGIYVEAVVDFRGRSGSADAKLFLSGRNYAICVYMEKFNFASKP